MCQKNLCYFYFCNIFSQCWSILTFSRLQQEIVSAHICNKIRRLTLLAFPRYLIKIVQFIFSFLNIFIIKYRVGLFEKGSRTEQVWSLWSSSSSVVEMSALQPSHEHMLEVFCTILSTNCTRPESTTVSDFFSSLTLWMCVRQTRSRMVVHIW